MKKNKKLYSGLDRLKTNSKPYTRWWWFNTSISKSAIKAQLDWFEKNNFGGVEIAWVYRLKGTKPGPKWLSPEWQKLVVYAKQYASTIGLACDFTFGTLWPFGGSFLKDNEVSMTFDGLSDQRIRVSWEQPECPPSRVLNHLDKTALFSYSKIMGDALKPALKIGGSSLFCDSLEVDPEKLWSSKLYKRFQSEFGYDIKKYTNSLDEYIDVRYDYRKFISKVMINEFYKPYTKICHKLNSVSRVQAHGSPTDLIESYCSADIPESEALLFDPEFSVIPASAAAIKNKPVTAETFTCIYGWIGAPNKPPSIKHEQVADLKLLADAMFANGVNHIIWHGAPYNTPNSKNEFYATVHVGKSGALSKHLKDFNLYLEQVSSFMKKGKTYSILGVYLPIEDAWMRNELPKNLFRPSAKYHWEFHYQRLPKNLSGYRPLWVSPYTLSKGLVQDKKFVCGKMKLNVLYVNSTWLDFETLKYIYQFAKKGLPIVIKKRPKQPGKVKNNLYEKELNRLLKLKNVFREFNRNILPPPLIEGYNNFWAREYRGKYLVFLPHPYIKYVTYPMTYGASYCEKIISKKIKINLYGASIKKTIKFHPYQSHLLLVDKKGRIEDIQLDYVPPDSIKEKSK